MLIINLLNMILFFINLKYEFVVCNLKAIKFRNSPIEQFKS